MGTKVQNLPGCYSMRDLNEESSSCGWPLLHGDKTHTNGQYYNDYQPRADGCSVYDKDFVKQMMLEHEAIFKKQVYELHRLYNVQKSLMDEAKNKELSKNCLPIEASFSTDRLVSQITSEDGQKWHYSGFPLANATGAARLYISGVEGVHSSLGSAQGNGKHCGLFPLSNGSSSKDVVIESRPSKARRKMLFDLQLPADQYLDTEESEKLSDENMRGTTTYPPDRNCTHEWENNVKLSCGNGGKAGSHEDSSQCDQSSRTRNGLADLNEPVQVEETTASAYGHLSHYSCQGTECSDLSAKEKSRFFNLSGDGSLNSYHRSDIRAQNTEYLENIGTGRGWIPSVLESGQAKSNGTPVPQVLKQEKSILPSQIGQDGLKKASEHPSDYLTNLSKINTWREKTVCNLEVSERSHEMSMKEHPESIASSHRVGHSAVTPSSNLAKSWSHSTSSGEMASSLNQKLMSFKMPPCLPGNLRKNSMSGQSDVIFGDSWPGNTNSKSNSGYLSEVPVQNGFYHGSSPGSQEPSVNISSISYDYLNHNNDYKGISEHLINRGSAKYNKGSSCNNMESGRDQNLNGLFSSGSSNNCVSQSGLGIMDRERKHEEHLAVLPWLKPKSSFKNELLSSGGGFTAGEPSISQAVSLFNIDKTGKGPSGNFMRTLTSASCSNDFDPRRTEAGDSSNIKKILGVPIFGMPHQSPKKECSSFTSPCVSIPRPFDAETVENNQKKGMLDINLPCHAGVLELEEQVLTENVSERKDSSTTEVNTRTQIDLNLSMSEDEESLAPISTSHVKMKPEIDLEAPAVPEVEEDATEEKLLETSLSSPRGSQDKVGQPEDELIECAVEVIVAISSLPCNQEEDMISSPSESPMVDPLRWFVDLVLDMSKEKCGEHNREESASEAMDYFESMTLKLTETKEEDYMPKPLVPEIFKADEPGAALLPTRTRKGPARRGRQQRDFQRDILPGIASLSRHEVTEDLQTFGGLMRATGHTWHSGLTRRSSSRNRCGRGRRRLQVTPSPPPPPPPAANNEMSTPLVQHLNNIEVVGLEDRSLTGWGKTTRRPRRQRCPAGNPMPILLA
ncbi:uncharacterized protein LOC129311350 [Prosopis cineraria]|uniref:uncharacterized protein LOC129311350 n=1 Tax=Prosopis cineraria TaxID=364024 RepID=UPI0024102245|nr:uncharacterized protein LOC129311350 [Prosopis cineraria]